MRTLLPFLLVSCFATTTFAGEGDPDGSQLKIEGASYGFEDKRIQVAELLRPHIRHGMLLIRAPWGLGNPDPKPGTVKDIVFVYRHNGIEATATFNQRQDILLPPPPANTLTIISASYGVSDSRVDVTEAVRAAVTNNAIRLPAQWSLGRVDPAAGKIKTVEITFTYDGGAATVIFSQNEELQLP